MEKVNKLVATLRMTAMNVTVDELDAFAERLNAGAFTMLIKSLAPRIVDGTISPEELYAVDQHAKELLKNHADTGITVLAMVKMAQELPDLPQEIHVDLPK